MFEYANEVLSNQVCTNFHTFPEQKSPYKFTFRTSFCLRVFKEQILDLSFCHFTTLTFLGDGQIIHEQISL